MIRSQHSGSIGGGGFRASGSGFRGLFSEFWVHVGPGQEL